MFEHLPLAEIDVQILAYLCAAAALVGLMAYAVLAGADFGGGVWDLFATGPRKQAQRDAIARAMGPVWEANHVWLIFVLVVLFTCFPFAYTILMNSLFLPLHLILAGIMLRGAAFVFRHYAPHRHAFTGQRHTGIISHFNIWGAVFGVASIISPFLMGLSFGVVTTGQIEIQNNVAVVTGSWFNAYTLACAFLALTTCAYLATCYLMMETHTELQEDFRRRSILSGTLTAAIALVTLVAARIEATWLLEQMLTPRALPILIVGAIAFALSAISVLLRWYRAARIFAVAQTLLMLLGWGMAHRDYLIYPIMPLSQAHAPASTLIFVLLAVPVGCALLFPSLYLLFRVFKSSRAARPQ